MNAPDTFNPAPGPIDPARWAVLSPWLDQLLDADPADVSARDDLLAQAALQDPTLADELATLLRRLQSQADDGFMQTPAHHATPTTPIDATDDAAAGQRIGAYVVQRLLGRGGMGSVWLAQRSDGRYDGQVAIKFLHGGLSGRGDARRFAREGQILARLDHPHIARLLDAGSTAGDGRAAPAPARSPSGEATDGRVGPGADLPGGQPYLVLEYVPGLPIDEHVRLHALDTRATVALFMDVLTAVSHAHERLILHRDLKPSNILVTAGGQVKLLDFGIAKLVADALDTAPATQLTQQAGRAYTLRYAAPEQVEQREATTATDVYALGVLLYTLLTDGLHPTAAAHVDTPLAQLQALVHTLPRRPSEAVARQGGAPATKKLARALQGDLDTIIGRALKKQPAERYRNAAELADDLQRYLDHEPIAARPDSASYRLAKFLRRNRLGVAAGATVMLALGAGTALALQSAREATAQRTVANQQRAQAEGLIEFMLGDLRTRLAPVGRLDVLDAVGAKVLGYYEQQDPTRLDADALGRRGQALTLVGNMAELRGQLAEAERAHRQAVASLEELALREPRNPKRLLAYAQGLSGLATVQLRQGDLARAEQSQREALALSTRAAETKPGDVDLAIEVIDKQTELAIFYLDAGRPAEALPLLQQAHASALIAVRTKQAAWWHLINIRACMADAQYHLGRLAESIATIRTQLEAVAQMPGSEKDSEVQNLRALGINRMAGAQIMVGQLKEAADNFNEVLRTDLDLNQRDPANLSWLSNLVRHRLYVSEVLFWWGRAAEARDQLRQAEAAMPRLLAKPDAPLEWRIRLYGDTLLRRALLDPDDPQLLADLETHVTVLATPQMQAVKLTESQQRHMARTYLQWGTTLARRGREADAQAAWRTSLSMARASADRQRVMPTLAMMMQAHWRLGHAAEADALAAEIDRSEYRHPEYIALRREMKSGG